MQTGIIIKCTPCIFICVFVYTNRNTNNAHTSMYKNSEYECTHEYTYWMRTNTLAKTHECSNTKRTDRFVWNGTRSRDSTNT